MNYLDIWEIQLLLMKMIEREENNTYIGIFYIVHFQKHIVGLDVHYKQHYNYQYRN